MKASASRASEPSFTSRHGEVHHLVGDGADDDRFLAAVACGPDAAFLIGCQRGWGLGSRQLGRRGGQHCRARGGLSCRLARAPGGIAAATFVSAPDCPVSLVGWRRWRVENLVGRRRWNGFLRGRLGAKRRTLSRTVRLCLFNRSLHQVGAGGPHCARRFRAAARFLDQLGARIGPAAHLTMEPIGDGFQHVAVGFRSRCPLGSQVRIGDGPVEPLLPRRQNTPLLHLARALRHR